MRSLGVLCLLAVLALPAAEAALTLDATPPAHDLVADKETADLQVHVGLDCTDLVGRWSDPTKPVDVTLRNPVADRPGILLSGTLVVHVDPTPCAAAPNGKAGGTSVLHVAASRAAPGETDIKATLTAVLPGGPGEAELQGSASPILRVGYFGLLVASVNQTIVTMHGHSATLKLHLQNLGNAPSTVNFEIVGAVPPGLNPVPPVPFTLQSAAQGGEGAAGTEQTVNFLVGGRGSWSQAELALSMVPASTKTPSLRGEPVVIHFLLRNGDRVLGVPSLGAPLTVAALLVGALLVSRRRA